VPLSPWHDASHLGLGGLVLLRINPHEPPGPKVHVRGEGVSPMASGCATVAAMKEPQENITPKGGKLHLIPTPPRGLVKLFSSVEPEGLRHLNGTLRRQLK
jgi:hypothetical protein